MARQPAGWEKFSARPEHLYISGHEPENFGRLQGGKSKYIFFKNLFQFCPIFGRNSAVFRPYFGCISAAFRPRPKPKIFLEIFPKKCPIFAWNLPRIWPDLLARFFGLQFRAGPNFSPKNRAGPTARWPAGQAFSSARKPEGWKISSPTQP